MGWYIIVGLSRIRPRKIRQLKEHDDAAFPQVQLYLLSLADVQPSCKRPGHYELDHGACPSVVPHCRASRSASTPVSLAACPVLCRCACLVVLHGRTHPVTSRQFRSVARIFWDARCGTCRGTCPEAAGPDLPSRSRGSHGLSRRSRRHGP